MDERKIEIECRGGVLDGKRVDVTLGISGLRVPTNFVVGSGYGSQLYRPTGQFAAPGVEIWAPQIGKGH